MATPTNPLLRQLRQNVEDTQKRIEESQRQANEQAQSLTSLISTPPEGYDAEVEKNPLLAAVHGRASRVSAAETGQLGTFNQFFRERVSARDVMADFFTGLGATRAGKKTLSLRDQKFQEFELEQQAAVRRQQAEAVNQKALQDSFRKRVEVLQKELETTRGQTSKDLVKLAEQKTALAKEEQSDLTAEEEKNEALVKSQKDIQEKLLDKYEDTIGAVGYDMVLESMQDPEDGSGLLSEEQRDQLEEMNNALLEKEAAAKKRQEGSGLGVKDLGSFADVAFSQGLDKALTAAGKEGAPVLMRYIKDNDILVPRNNKARETVDDALNALQSNALILDFYNEALKIATGAKSIDELTTEELNGFRGKLNGYIAMAQGFLGENAPETVLKALGFSSARQLLQSQGEDRFSDPDLRQALKQIVSISNTPEEARLLTRINSRQAIMTAYQAMRTGYTAPEVGQVLSWEQAAKVLLVQDGRTMRERLESLVGAGQGISF